MDHRPVVDLGADGGRPEDQGNERDDRRHHQRVVELAGDLRRGAQAAADDEDGRDADGREGEEADEEDPAPPEETTHGDVDERAEDRRAEHGRRRATRNGRR